MGPRLKSAEARTEPMSALTEAEQAAKETDGPSESEKVQTMPSFGGLFSNLPGHVNYGKGI